MIPYYYVVTIYRENGRNERSVFNTYFGAIHWVEIVRSYSDYKIIIERRCDDVEEKEGLT